MSKAVCGLCIHFDTPICKKFNDTLKDHSDCNDYISISKETVNHPEHYNQGIEAIDIIESWNLNFSLGNAIKYILRAPYKGSKGEDIQKAIWYLERELQRKESKEENIDTMEIYSLDGRLDGSNIKTGEYRGEVDYEKE